MKRGMRAIALTMGLIVLLMAFGGCKRPDEELSAQAGSEVPSIGEPSTPMTEPEEKEPFSPTPLAIKDLTEEVSYDDGWPDMHPDAQFCAKQMNFSIELFRRAAEKEGCENTLVSPLSVTMALAMTANGAEGTTAQEMLNLWGGYSVNDLNALLGNWRMSLESGEKPALKIGNSIWIRDMKGFEVKEKFLQDNAKYYHSQIYKAPFDAACVNAINTWVNNETEGMIPQILDRLDAESRMVLINAVSFDAQWLAPYSKSFSEPFTALNGKEQTAQMMYSHESTYLEGEEAIGFLRPYKDGRYAFGALLPEGDFQAYVQNFTGAELLDILKNKQSAEVHAALPQFKKDYSASMNDILREMGMREAFRGGFGKMTNIKDEFFISEVLHRSSIEVNLDGTRAAAATAVLMESGAAVPQEPPKVVTLDRPFIYFILDTQTNLPIFIGTVTSL